MTDWKVLPLSIDTFEDFAAVIENGHGAWGGCWCMGFHAPPEQKITSVAESRRAKERLVREGKTHAALVYDGTRVIGWCQFGATDELPRIKHRREYEKTPSPKPDWRITCFFVDTEYRHKGVAHAAVAGALREIAVSGGGVVESYPEETEGRKVSGSFLYNAPISLFEKQGFERVRRLGMHHWVVSKNVQPLANQ